MILRRLLPPLFYSPHALAPILAAPSFPSLLSPSRKLAANFRKTCRYLGREGWLIPILWGNSLPSLCLYVSLFARWTQRAPLLRIEVLRMKNSAMSVRCSILCAIFLRWKLINIMLRTKMHYTYHQDRIILRRQCDKNGKVLRT